MTLLNQKVSLELRYTSLPRDALKDEGKFCLFRYLMNSCVYYHLNYVLICFLLESVVLDITFEELAMRGYFTKNVNTHITTLLSARATLIHATGMFNNISIIISRALLLDRSPRIEGSISTNFHSKPEVPYF